MKAELRKIFGSTVTTHDLWSHNKKYLERARSGELKQVKRGVWDLTGEDAPVVLNLQPVIDAETIRQRFEVMGLLADGVADKNIRSLIIAGAPGVGKTFELERKLKHAERSGKITSMISMKGSISAFGVYETLWNNREAGQVILLDDIDAVFDNEEALNLLKAALDTGKRRNVSWQKASRLLQERDIPNSFDYCGQIVFISNLDPDKIIAKGGRLAPHMAALISRSVFLDLCIHDNESIMIRVEQVLTDSTLAEDLNLNSDEVEDILDFMKSNVKRLRQLSIRTVLQLASFIKTTEDWQVIAEATMLRPAR